MAPTRERDACTPEQTAGLRVLVVDESRDAAGSQFLLLDIWGHRPQAPLDADVAFRPVAHDPPDVVLIDLALSGRDSLALARDLRARPGMQGARFFAVGGHSAPAHRDGALASAFDEFLLKPFDPDAHRGLLAGLPRSRPGV